MTVDPTIHLVNDLLSIAIIIGLFTVANRTSRSGVMVFCVGVIWITLITSGVDSTVKILVGRPTFTQWLYHMAWIGVGLVTAYTIWLAFEKVKGERR